MNLTLTMNHLVVLIFWVMNDLPAFLTKILLFDWKILQFFNFLLNRFDINDLFINFGYFLHWIILLPNNLSRDVLNNCFLLIINDSFSFGTHLGIHSSFVIYNIFLVRYVWDSALAYESLYLVTLYKLALSELWPSQPSDIFWAQPFALRSLALSQCGSVSVFVRCWIWWEGIFWSN